MAAAAAMLMSSFPEEIQVEILLKLPVKELLTCKCVCKLWLNLISSPKFMNDHLKISIQNKNNYKIMFTCNGLICFGILIDAKISICIWNPTTTEFKEIQHCDFHINPEQTFRGGFCYDSKTRDYKMVRIVNSKKSDCCEVEVYTFGSHLSKAIHTFPYKFPTRIAFRGFFLNGALHWISSFMSKQDISNYIVSFDISNEKFLGVPLPEKSIINSEDINTKIFTNVGVLGNCLTLVLVDKKRAQAEVWVMQDYAVRESRTKLFTTTQKSITCYPFWAPMLSLKMVRF
ncbi:putative F-box protein At3g16210 [Papaver somniferum]|uniref:putative F-box protein At3g16210 n=1 Tax=Papaver somniferum TaxID=3469 RepID=UPI000E705640|nr:putative F-box protein At3g16210 [Papaver somniferum]